ncbi:DNA replication and repair protein RecO [Chryseolinea serpens]|uniref:DNA repair protein RecO n=1 Tax=Chryseolinea serpens TaxID=947013 RepID=A0A1M5PAH0_9BACT|nr:DNA repair protein RecO [Chryseolinea serpens]SHG98834.1 DNA replication and repair protein RecO [Chryseolinea serpens]
MLHKTRGIVFRFTKYGETSIIVNIFTELFGLQSYIVNGVRSKSSKNKIALYQPLTLLEMVVYHRENANINRIKEVKCFYPYQTIPVDIKKSALAIFINEVLNKTVKDESHAQDLCTFLMESLQALDQMTEKAENFHLLFLLKLSRLLGFGAYNLIEVLGPRASDEETERLLAQLIPADYNTFIALTNTQRRAILELLLKFYADHIDTFGEMRSVQVLRDVMG